MDIDITEILPFQAQYFSCLDIAAFSFAFSGAMGEHGEVYIITVDGKVYHLNYCNNKWSKEQMYTVLPLLKDCDFPIFGDSAKVPNGYSFINLGMGNNLVLKSELKTSLLDKHEECVTKGEGKILYQTYLKCLTEILTSTK